jgi:ribosomal protein S18 acetylase RimI-like enzyme
VIAVDRPLALLSRIEDAGINASAPQQQRWIDGWLVRFSPAKAQRARCINALSDGQMTVEQRLAACQTLYDQADLRLLVRITPFSRPADLDALLAAKGFERFGDTQVMLLPSLAGLPQSGLNDGLRFAGVTSEAYAHIVGEFRGSPAAFRVIHAQRLAFSPVPYSGIVIRDSDDQTLACGQFALEGDRVGLYDLFTAPHARGRGLARQLCLRLLELAGQRGAEVAYLQVEAQNRSAQSVYRQLGFVDAYAYHYRACPVAG